jgi:hypothetical protein
MDVAVQAAVIANGDFPFNVGQAANRTMVPNDGAGPDKYVVSCGKALADPTACINDRMTPDRCARPYNGRGVLVAVAAIVVS